MSTPEPALPTAADMLVDVDLAGRTVVVTGATAGMGLASAVALAGAGARVGLLARNPEALSQAEALVAAAATDQAPFAVPLDLASLASVRAAAESVVGQAPRIDVLMNNAGVMFTPFGRTVEGFETQVGVCHLGHFLLTDLLVPGLRRAAAAYGEARLVVLSSAGHRMADLDLADPNWESRSYDKFAAYGAAKTANILHTVEFDRRHAGEGVRAWAVHPGTVATNLARHMTREDFSTMFSYGASTDSTRSTRRARVATPEQGASTQVWAAVAPELSGRGGGYLADRAVSDDVAEYALDPDRAARWWEISEALTS